MHFGTASVYYGNNGAIQSMKPCEHRYKVVRKYVSGGFFGVVSHCWRCGTLFRRVMKLTIKGDAVIPEEMEKGEGDRVDSDAETDGVQFAP